uniref:uncharacterized protein LOC122583519 n=1 Tax=Erigeron canadensis TaxID=72917 RepID=UPI001CB8F727|nr:uncharacterized protein LOC122583519 [Erigeron canadensis]
MARLWTADETMNLARAWLEVSKDPNATRYQQGRTFWFRLKLVFNNLQNNQGEERTIESLQGKWRKMHRDIMNFQHIVARLNNQNNQNNRMVLENALVEYNLTHPQFLYIAKWNILRASAIFMNF